MFGLGMRQCPRNGTQWSGMEHGCLGMRQCPRNGTQWSGMEHGCLGMRHIVLGMGHNGLEWDTGLGLWH